MTHRAHVHLLAATAAGALALLGQACSSDSETSSSASGSTTVTAGQGGSASASGGAGATSTTSSAGGAGGGGASAGGAGGGTALIDCPIDAFAEDDQVVYDSSYVGDDVTWTKDKLYIVETDLNVNATITIEAGTTVCVGSDFSFGSPISIEVGIFSAGGVVAQGTATEPVVFTARDTNKGWGGIHCGPDAAIDLAYTQLHYASASDNGGGSPYSRGGFRIADNISDEASAARLFHVTFAGMKRGGALWVQSKAGLTSDSRVEVLGFDLAQSDLQYNDPAVRVGTKSLSSIEAGMITLSSDIPDPLRGVQVLHASDMTDDVTMHALDVPYIITDYVGVFHESGGSSLTMTIEPGTQIRFGFSAVLQAGGGFNGGAGNLVVAGTAADPIELLYYPFPGDVSPAFGALAFQRYDPAVSRVSHVRIEAGGANPSAEVSDACGDNSSTGAIVIGEPTGGFGSLDYAGISIDNTVIDGSVANGIVAECDSACIDAAVDYLDASLNNQITNVSGEPQILSSCP